MAALVDDYEDSEKVDRRASKKVDSFDRYISNLEQLGTYADNGCLVAFARLYQLDINIHQLNLPIWTIRGDASGKRDRQINLSYHNAEHYSSVRKLGDSSNTPSTISLNITHNQISKNDSKKPLSSQNNYAYSPSSSASSKQQQRRSNAADNSTNLTSSRSSSAVLKNKQQQKQQQKKSSYNSDRGGKENESSRVTSASIYDYDGRFDEKELNQNVSEIMNITGCYDLNLIKRELMTNENDVETALDSIMNKMDKSSLSNGNDDEHDADDDNEGDTSRPKGRKVDRKAEKKLRQMEKQKIRMLEEREKEMLSKQAVLNTKNIGSSQIIDPQEIQQRCTSASKQRLEANNDSSVNSSVEAKFI